MMPSFADVKDLSAKVIVGLHREVFMRTGGRIGGSGFGMPVLILKTIGRKSGKERTTMLTSPVQDGETVVIVASYGGDNRHPTWFLNLRDNPDVEITMRGRTRKMKARVASTEERADLWPRVTGKYRGYASYQTRTDREIPLVLLEPADAG
jgi:deazaflavin-dependent oxidoreductase (nitroreductase family)